MQHRSFVHRRVVRWGDCDPAGIVYTPRGLDYATEAVEAFWTDVAGVHWVRMNKELNRGAPTVHASIDFVAPMRPELELEIHLTVEKLGQAAITFAISGRDSDGREYFRSRMVVCWIVFDDIKSAEIPDFVRTAVVPYCTG